MTPNNMLMKLEPQNLAELENVAEIFAKSGLFTDARQMAQAFVKIMAGRELGFGAFASMNGINIIQGKPAMGANLIAAAIKRHPSPRYDYRVITLTNDECVLDFYQDGVKVGESSFTKADAAVAKLASKDNWSKNPRNMLFARAISNGARWYCPDVFGGPVYTPDEMGAEMDDDGEVIPGEYEETPALIAPPSPRRMDTSNAYPADLKPTGVHNGTEPLPGDAIPEPADDYNASDTGEAQQGTLIAFEKPADWDTRKLSGATIEMFVNWVEVTYPQDGGKFHATGSILKALKAKSWADVAKGGLTCGEAEPLVTAYFAEKAQAQS
jgi:hypothetical protein